MTFYLLFLPSLSPSPPLPLPLSLPAASVVDAAVVKQSWHEVVVVPLNCVQLQPVRERDEPVERGRKGGGEGQSIGILSHLVKVRMKRGKGEEGTVRGVNHACSWVSLRYGKDAPSSLSPPPSLSLSTVPHLSLSTGCSTH